MWETYYGFMITDFENCSDPTENNQLQSMPSSLQFWVWGRYTDTGSSWWVAKVDHHYHIFCAHVDTDEDKKNIPLLGNSYW